MTSYDIYRLVFQLGRICLVDPFTEPSAQTGIIAWSDGEQPLPDGGTGTQTEVDILQGVVDGMQAERNQVGAVSVFSIASCVQPGELLFGGL